MAKSFEPYGSIPEMDALVDSASVDDRIKAAEMGYGLEALYKDTSGVVRFTVVEQGYGCNALKGDRDEVVRAEVAKRCPDEMLEEVFEGYKADNNFLVGDALLNERHYNVEWFANECPDDALKADAQRILDEQNAHQTLVNRGKEIIEEEINDHPDGYDIYFNYDDTMSEERVLKAYESYCDRVATPDEPYSLENMLYEGVYEDWNLFLQEDDCLDYFCEHLSPDDRAAVDAYVEGLGYSDVKDLITNEYGSIGVKFDLNDVMGDYKVNLMFGTGVEKNTDMSSIYEMFYGYNKETRETLKTFQEYADGIAKESPDELINRFDNSMTYLIIQQGHTVPEVAEDYYEYCKSGNHLSESPFVCSVVQEMADYDYSMQELTALITISSVDDLAVLESVAHGRGDITLSQDTTIGLYNEWNGSGSALEIELEKPLTIPANMIRNVQIENATHRLHQYEYTVDGTYGLVGSCWKGQASLDDSKESVVLSRDDFVNIAADIKSLAEIDKEKDKSQERND